MRHVKLRPGGNVDAAAAAALVARVAGGNRDA
jgi:hypothetical protein